MTSSSNFLSLFENQTETGISKEVLFSGRSQMVKIHIQGVLGGGNLTIETKPNPGNSNIPDLDFSPESGGNGLTELESKTLFIPAYTYVRAILRGATGANLTVGIYHQ